MPLMVQVMVHLICCCCCGVTPKNTEAVRNSVVYFQHVSLIHYTFIQDRNISEYQIPRSSTTARSNWLSHTERVFCTVLAQGRSTDQSRMIAFCKEKKSHRHKGTKGLAVYAAGGASKTPIIYSAPLTTALMQSLYTMHA